MATPLRIVKVGGSLLEMPHLGQRLQKWLEVQPAAHAVLVVGGGSLVQQVRDWDQRWNLDEVTAHWICVDLMSATARLFKSRLLEVPLTSDVDRLKQLSAEPGCTVFDAARWMRETEPELPGTTLPPSWDVTSDSIAARLAVALRAEELVLLKSVLPEEVESQGIAALAANGAVDEMLPRLFAELPPVRMVNLRADPPREAPIQALAPPPCTL